MTTAFQSVAEIPSGYWRWAHFSPTELADRRDGSLLIDSDFLDALEALRRLCGFPLPLSSAYRTPSHNAEVSSTKSRDGAHTLGVAVDIAISGSDPKAYIVLRSAFALGFQGIEATTDHLHLDMAPSRPDAPRPYFWVSV
jgi:uncharacterized protein YcbK (DUF882 family)